MHEALLVHRVAVSMSGLRKREVAPGRMRPLTRVLPKNAIDLHTMQIARLVPLTVFLSTAAPGKTADTGTAHKAAATALLNSNNTWRAPAAIFPEPTANPPGGGPADTLFGYA